MKPGPFEYHDPNTVEQAVALLGTYDNAKVLAGGQSLVPMMNFRYVMPDHIIDINNIADLTRLEERDGRLHIGAAVRQRELEFSDLVARRYPLIAAALRHVGHRQTRNRGTLGGSLAHADPSAELPNVCSAMDAVVHIAGPRGSRQVPFAGFNLAFMTTAVEPDELLTAVEIAPWAEGHGYSFQEFARRHGDFAVVGVAALLEIDGRKITRAALSACGISTGPIRLRDVEDQLLGETADDGLIASASALAREVEAIGDHHASADYRRHLAGVLCSRALKEARERAVAGKPGGNA